MQITVVFNQDFYVIYLVAFQGHLNQTGYDYW